MTFPNLRWELKHEGKSRMTDDEVFAIQVEVLPEIYGELQCGSLKEENDKNYDKCIVCHYY